MLGKDGAARQPGRYKKIIGHLGKVGVDLIAYNFTPDERGRFGCPATFDAKVRGGKRTSASAHGAGFL